MIKNIPLLLFIVLTCFACKPTTQLQVIRPAAITLPDHIQTLAIIDRSKPRSGFVNVLEGGATGEAINQDRNGRRRALEVLNQTLSRTPRFKVIDTGYEYTGSESGSTFAPPLGVREIEEICVEHGADAVIALEKFDSNNFSDVSPRKRKKKNDDGTEVEITVFDAKAEVDVEIGWRIYDFKSGDVIDEVSVNDVEEDSESGADSEEDAFEGLKDPKQLTYAVSKKAGRKYAERIAPLWIKVNRTFFKNSKGPESTDMERAARLFEADSWEKAADIWQNILQSSADEKTKGMAAYNMAVASEKRGLLSSALDWAQRAYGEYGNKKAKNYLDTIRDRMADQERLQRQMQSRT